MLCKQQGPEMNLLIGWRFLWPRWYCAFDTVVFLSATEYSVADYNSTRMGVVVVVVVVVVRYFFAMG